jgi:hypothetical protein
MERDLKPEDNYLQKLNTLLPGEVTALYLFIRSLERDDRDLDLILGGFVILIGAVFFFVAPKLLNVKDPIARGLYVLTFFLWVASIEISSLVYWTNFKPTAFIVTGLTAIWTFTLPFVFDALKKSGGVT